SRSACCTSLRAPCSSCRRESTPRRASASSRPPPQRGNTAEKPQHRSVGSPMLRPPAEATVSPMRATTSAGAVDVILRDGPTLRLGPPRPRDADALVSFLEPLSQRSPYQPFP